MGFKGEMVPMAMSDGATIGVYRVAAEGSRRGGLVLIQEIFGVTDHIKELSDGFAAEGYEVLAPALFDREAPGFSVPYTPEGIEAGVKLAREAHPFDLSIADAQVCIDALKDKGPVFIVGYCYGGSVAWAASCRCEGLAAASGYYGGMIPRLADETPKCPVILHFGRLDQGIPLEGIEDVRARHPDVDIHLYEAGHGFNSDRRKDYHAESARLARQRTLDLFRGHGA
jgi:carboxymethylenebutenolidase